MDYISDKSLYPAQGSGMLGGLAGMVIWLFPLNAWTGALGFFLTLGTTAITTMTVLVITGLYKKHEQRILAFFEKRPKFLKHGKKEDNERRA